MNIKQEHIIEARKLYSQNKNIEQYLKGLTDLQYSPSDIAEVSFDIQAGAYIKDVCNESFFIDVYAKEYVNILQKFISSNSILLDVGCGELTTLSHIIKNIPVCPRVVAAMDISLSRIISGVRFSTKQLGNKSGVITPFVGDAFHIPLMNGAVDVAVTNYGLYSYGNQVDLAIKEIYRVTKERVLLFENCYSKTTDSYARERMIDFGYVLDFEDVIKKTGGRLDDIVLMKNNRNPLTPTACYVVTPPGPEKTSSLIHEDLRFSIPGKNYSLVRYETFFASPETGLCFPIIERIPILKPDSAILGSALLLK